MNPIIKDSGYFDQLPKERQEACNYLFRRQSDLFLDMNSCYGCPFYSEELIEREPHKLDTYNACYISVNENWERQLKLRGNNFWKN